MRGARRRRNLDRGFILSDHADWDGLLSVIKGTEAEEIKVTHGNGDALTRYLVEHGYNCSVWMVQESGERRRNEKVCISFS